MQGACQDPLLLPKPSDGLTHDLLCPHSHPADNYTVVEKQQTNINSSLVWRKQWTPPSKSKSTDQPTRLEAQITGKQPGIQNHTPNILSGSGTHPSESNKQRCVLSLILESTISKSNKHNYTVHCGPSSMDQVLFHPRNRVNNLSSQASVAGQHEFHS